MSRITLSRALEYAPDSWAARDTALEVPVAAEWLRIARDEVEQMCLGESEAIKAGDLWSKIGGGDVCNYARFLFWESRLEVLKDVPLFEVSIPTLA